MTAEPEKPHDQPLSQTLQEGQRELECINQCVVERSNLLNLTKLIVKALVEASMRGGQSPNDTSPAVKHLFAILEQVMSHRLKVKRNLLGQRRSFWSVIEIFDRTFTSSSIFSPFLETVAAVKSIVGIKTLIGRGRAWLRISLMRKELADNFKMFIENKLMLSECYEEDALMMSEGLDVITGLLMGLNVLDYTVMLTGEEFDRPPGEIDLSHFLKDGNYLGKPLAIGDENEEKDESEDTSSTQLTQLLDQKAYLEELNKKLQSQVDRLQSRLDKVTVENTSMRDQLSGLISSVETVTTERDNLQVEKDKNKAEMSQKLEAVNDDKKAELETYLQTRAGLNDLYAATQKSLDSEHKLREQLEQEVALMKVLKEEKEIALQLLEKSVHEKQDSLVSLRKQVEELKNANLKIKSQVKASKDTHQKDSLKIRTLETQLSELSASKKYLDNQLQQTKSLLHDSERTCKDLAGRLEEVQLGRSSAESDLSIEKQWRTSLQIELQKEKDRVVELTNEIKKFKALKQAHAELQEKYACLQETISEQEIGLVEMGRQLSLAQQKLSDMKQESQVMKESVWKDDKEVPQCQICLAAFSVARRKHHCRNCGGVFCSSCSDNTLQLASSAKPVRVCDHCYTMLLERSSTS